MRETRINDRGNTVASDFQPGDRYTYDFDLCTHAKGWEQYDTDQDAHYFGVWVHKAQRQIFTYCEGDISLVTCPTVDSYNAEIASMNAFYGEGRMATTIDDNGTTIYRQDRQQFFLRQEVSA